MSLEEGKLASVAGAAPKALDMMIPFLKRFQAENDGACIK